jgi:hypothetical protein
MGKCYKNLFIFSEWISPNMQKGRWRCEMVNSMTGKRGSRAVSSSEFVATQHICLSLDRSISQCSYSNCVLPSLLLIMDWSTPPSNNANQQWDSEIPSSNFKTVLIQNLLTYMLIH